MLPDSARPVISFIHIAILLCPASYCFLYFSGPLPAPTATSPPPSPSFHINLLPPLIYPTRLLGSGAPPPLPLLPPRRQAFIVDLLPPCVPDSALPRLSSCLPAILLCCPTASTASSPSSNYSHLEFTRLGSGPPPHSPTSTYLPSGASIVDLLPPF